MKTGRNILIIAILAAYVALSLGFAPMLLLEENQPAYSELAGHQISAAARAYQEPVATTFVRTESRSIEQDRHLAGIFGLVCMLLGGMRILYAVNSTKLITRKEFYISELSTFLGGVSPPVYAF